MIRLGRIAAVAVIAATSLIATNAPEAKAAYALNQYRQPDRSVCVQISTTRATLAAKVDWAAYQLSSKTDLTMWDARSCSGNKITIRAGFYGTRWKDYSRGSTSLWVTNGIITRADVYINLSYSISGAAGSYVVLHELIHGVLGTKHSSSCYSIMARSWSYSCDVWWLTADARNAIDWAY